MSRTRVKKAKPFDFYKERDRKLRKDDAALQASIERKDEVQRLLREVSGNVTSSDRLAAFLYQLMRDHVPFSVVAQLLIDNPPDRYRYTNGFVARFAIWAAKELRK